MEGDIGCGAVIVELDIERCLMGGERQSRGDEVVSTGGVVQGAVGSHAELLAHGQICGIGHRRGVPDSVLSSSLSIDQVQ